MRLHSLLGRLVLPVAVTGLALGGPGLPARADKPPTFPLVVVSAPEQVTVIQGTTKTVTLDVANLGTADAEDLVVTFGSAELPVAKNLGLVPPAGCTAAACTIGHLAAGAKRAYRFTLTPAASTTDLGSTFAIVPSYRGDAYDFDTEVTVLRAKGGVDLEISRVPDLKLAPGRSATVPVMVRNTGTKDVDGVAVALGAYTGLETLTKYRNCKVEDDEDLSGLICVFDQKLAAGGTCTVAAADALQIRVAPNAAGPFEYPAFVAAVGLDANFTTPYAAKLATASGPTLRLEPAPKALAAGEPDDINLDDNVADFTVTVPRSAADSVAVGGTFAGATGDTGTVKIGVRDAGPTDLIPGTRTWLPNVRVTVPGGIELTDVDEDCLPGTSLNDIDLEADGETGGRNYVCLLFEGLTAGDQHLFSFTGRISDAAHPAGTVIADGGVQDSHHQNDKAAFTVKATAGGSGGSGGTLPITGTPTGLIAGGGVALLPLGGAAFALNRRRRIVTVTD
jgi:hypothetical protein